MSEWKEYKLGDLCTITSSKRCYLSERSDGGVPFYRSKEIIQLYNGYAVEQCDYISEQQYEQIEKKFGVPQENDILLTTRGTIGIPYIISKDDRFYFADGNLTWLKSFSELLMPQYLYYWFQAKSNVEQLDSIAIGAAQKALSIINLKQLQIRIPSIHQQERIVYMLRIYDQLIKTNNRRITILEEMAQQLYREWFVHFRFTSHEMVKLVESELGIPEGWSFGKISDICEKIFSGGTPTTTNETYWNGTIPWLSSGETRKSFIVSTEKCITDSGVQNSSTRQALKNDVVVASAGQGKTRGQTSFLLLDTFINQSVISLRAKSNFSEYLFFNLQGRYNELRNSSDASSIRGSITTVLIGSMPVLIPDIDTLTRFAAIVRPQIEQIGILRRQNKTLRRTRDLLLPRLVSGNIDVSDDEIIVREA